MDGANIEIREEIGHDNMFIFGALAHEVEGLRKNVKDGKIPVDPRLAEVVQMLRDGVFGEFLEVSQLLDSFLNSNDYYLLTADWASYLDAQARVDAAFKNADKWTRMSILSTAGCGKFSSDRSIQTYAEQIWNIKPSERPGPVTVNTEQLAAAFEGTPLSSSVGKAISSSVGRQGHFGTSPINSADISVERLTDVEAEFIQSTSVGGTVHKRPAPSKHHRVFFQ